MEDRDEARARSARIRARRRRIRRWITPWRFLALSVLFAALFTVSWEAIRGESDEIYQAFAQLMTAGTPATDPAAADLVDRHRDHISRWFYECTPQIHAGLGQMYVADARFTENFDATAKGLASYMSRAIAARYQGGP